VVAAGRVLALFSPLLGCGGDGAGHELASEASDKSFGDVRAAATETPPPSLSKQ